MKKVPVLYHLQAADACVNLYDRSARTALKNRQFEWTSCGERHDKIETGLVEWELDDEYLPVAVGGSLTTNRGVKGENFARWFKEVEGLSTAELGDFVLSGDEENLIFESGDFHPVEGLFTMNFGLPFITVANGKEEFEITADDDTFVFVGDKLVIDMGGVHSATTGRFVINENAEIYAAVGNQSLAYTGVNLSVGEAAVIRVYHANRDSKNSVFSVRVSSMVLSVTEKNGEATVAYDPTNPGAVAPMGESLTVGLEQSRMMDVVAAVKGMSFGLIMVCITAIIFAVVKRWQRAHSQEE